MPLYRKENLIKKEDDMNTPVSFELAKLLKEKKFKPTKLFGYISKFYNPNTETLLAYGRTGRIDLSKAYFAPTIAEVVMWLYEKHKVWVQGPFPLNNGKWEWVVFFLKEPLEGSNGFKNRMSIVEEVPYYHTPTEAYEAAIEHVLKNLIN